MAKKAKARVKLPKSAKKGDVVQVKTLISHKMETGLRKDKKTGKKIPRKIINKFVASYNGKEVFSADWHPAVSANPFISFYVRATDSGTMNFQWTDDDSTVYEKSANIKVT